MTTWRKLVIYCISLIGCFFTFIAADLACGGEVDPYDYYVSFFHHNTTGKQQYGAFHFTNYRFLYSDDEPVSEADINAAEWSAYLGKSVKAADVVKAMYRLSPKTDSVLYRGYLEQKGSLPDSLESNSFLKSIVNNKGALKYYRFAKSLEKVANVAYDSWNPKPVDSVALRAQSVIAFNSGLHETDKFLQLRYYYQTQRLLHYSMGYTQARAVYNKYIVKTSSTSHVKGWALALRAGEERRLKNNVLSAYLFSKVFAQYPERRVQAFRNYRYMDVRAGQVLALATNAEERANIFAITGFGNPQLNMEPLRQVYSLSPQSPAIGVLLVREINKLEEYVLTNKLQTPQFAGSFMGNTLNGTRQQYMQQLKDFCKQLAGEKRYTEPQIGTLAAAYIAWMQGNTEDGSGLLKSLYGVKLNADLDNQRQIVQLLLSAQNIKQFDKVNEAALLPALQWLDKKVKDERAKDTAQTWDYAGTHPFYATARNFYTEVLAPAYLKQGDTAMTALTLAKGGDASDFWQNYLHSGNINTILKWRTTASVTLYVNFLLHNPGLPKKKELYELLGTSYLREHDYANAVTTFKMVDTATLNRTVDGHTPADPFIELINDYPKVYTYSQDKGYNKLQFAEAMNNLQQQLKTDPDNLASYYYKMAVGMYNTSHYGNAWYLISYNWSALDFGRPVKYSYDTDYVKTSNAEEYFMIAQKYGKTPEFKAKCTFMAAKCRQKQAEMPDYTKPDFTALQKAYFAQLRSNDHFNELLADYKRTAFYKKAATECSYLKDYLETK